MTPETLNALPTWMNEIQVDRLALSTLLGELGIHLDTDLAPSFMLAAQDMLMCVELAETLPEGADYLAACKLLHTVSTGQPEPVQLVQQAVARNYLAWMDGRAGARVGALLDLLDL